MQEKIVEKIKITPFEVRAFYNKIPVDSLPLYESEVSIAEIILHPKANRDIEEYVIKQLSDYRRQIESGINKFDQLVKLYSEDPSSKENLGQFNINRNEKTWDPAFMAGSFRLKEGQISAPIKSILSNLFHVLGMTLLLNIFLEYHLLPRMKSISPNIYWTV
jgi:peptidyl-prolyl cis-trans isomerase SurA